MRPPLAAFFCHAFVATASLICTARAEDDLHDYLTPATAQTIAILPSAVAASGAVGFLGVNVAEAEHGGLKVVAVDDWSPAEAGGILPGDLLAKVAGESFATSLAFREWLHTRAPGEEIEIDVQRAGVAQKVTARLTSASHPLRASEQRAFVGFGYAEPDDSGAAVLGVAKDSPAAAAGIRVGDVVTRIADTPVTSLSTLSDVLSEKEPDDSLPIALLRGEERLTVTLKLGRAVQNGAGSTAPLPAIWKRDTFKLAVISVQFSDVKMNPLITPAAWEDSLFSLGSYTEKSSVTGQRVSGSLADFYREVSVGKLTVSGHAFPPVEVAKKREEYATATSEPVKAEFLREAIDKLLARDGKDALKGFDGLIFIYAGERYPRVNRGTLFWPHRSRVVDQGVRWSYYICAEGGAKMTAISVFCHEFGHMVGLPDLYARPENPGSEGLGIWCLMSDNRGGGKPQHPSAWCKEQLGWLKPAVLDPRVLQKLVLGPVEGSATEAFKVLLRPDGSEYLLLENRRQISFDASLPAAGLLIWHIVGRRPMLEESHGVEGPLGPRVFLSTVPYPSRANSSFTPFTTPSSRAQLGGGLPVYLTNIRQHDDGRVSFQIGYEYE